MPQTILAHMLSLVNHHDVAYKDAAACTALRFKVSILYVEALFSRGI